MSNIINFPSPKETDIPTDSAASAQIITPGTQPTPALEGTPDTPAKSSDPSQNTQPLNDPIDELPRSYDGLLEDVTKEYCERSGGQRDIDCIRAELVTETQSAFALANLSKPKGAKFAIPRSLLPIQIAMLMLAFHSICNIECSDDGQEPVLGLYMTDGDEVGTYQTADRIIESLIHRYDTKL